MPFRIISGPRVLDKLSVWVALPFGGTVGALSGYLLAQPDLAWRDLLLAALIVIAVLWCGLSAPRAVHRKTEQIR